MSARIAPEMIGVGIAYSNRPAVEPKRVPRPIEPGGATGDKQEEGAKANQRQSRTPGSEVRASARTAERSAVQPKTLFEASLIASRDPGPARPADTAPPPRRAPHDRPPAHATTSKRV